MKRLLSKLFANVNDGISIHGSLDGFAYYVYNFANASDPQDPLTKMDYLMNSLKLYSGLVNCEERGGHLAQIKLDNQGKAFSIPPFDPEWADRSLKYNLSISSSNNEIFWKMMDAKRHESPADLVKAATHLYSQAIFAFLHGYSYRLITPDGPDGGEPVFEDGQQSQKGERPFIPKLRLVA